jgi:hypothetical protein
MALLFPAAYQFLDSNGNPVASGTITCYDTGTANLRAIYSDIDMQVVASNPYSLDASGRLGVNIYGSGRYSVVLKDSGGATIWSRDDVFGIQEVTGIDGAEVTADILPDTDSTRDLGSAAKRYAEVHSDLYYVLDAKVARGAGTPESAVAAEPGSIFLRSDGSAGVTVYVKETGTGNTGWKALMSDLAGSKTHDFDGTDGATTTLTVTGAETDDDVIVTWPDATADVNVRGYVSAADTVTLVKTGAGNPGSLAYNVRVIKR